MDIFRVNRRCVDCQYYPEPLAIVQTKTTRHSYCRKKNKSMTPKRKQRLILLSMMLVGVTVAVVFALTAFNQNIMLFKSPTDIVAGDMQAGGRFRIGGMVVEDSVKRSDADLQVEFELSDGANKVRVVFDDILPDLFSEGQGFVAMGSLDANGSFIATEVLAKHDENYMPPEVAEALEKAGKMPGSAANYSSTTVVQP
jgi:cytochrome c-type biogenesis protein CcmE